jgi:putative NADPH-quinone reductase
MTKNVLIIDGHPDPAAGRFAHALADAYREGAESAKHEVLVFRLADMEFPMLRTQDDYEHGDPVDSIRRCQQAMDWATHVVIIYPLWLGSMPALLKGLLEQMLRPGFAYSNRKLGRWPVKLQSGKTARIIVTMGMPGWLYRWYFRAHSLRSLQRNILRFIGFGRVRATVFGNIGSVSRDQRRCLLQEVRALGLEAR